ncbi:MAG TPA: glycosyltransferase family 39 protein [Candidatus Eisenbacteria bacterium]
MRRLLLVLAAASVAAAIAVSALRIGYPFELEWLEGLSLHHVQRLLEGRPLFAAPSLEFIAAGYTPLYWAAGAAAARLLGPGFAALRAVSFASSLASLALIFALVRRETRSAYAAALAAGLFAAGFRFAGAFFDVARADALHLALLLGAILALRAMRGAAAAGALGGVLLGLATLTKQSAVVAAAPFVAWQLGADRRRGAWLIGTLAAVLGASTLGLQRATQGWYLYYALDVAARHDPVLASFPMVVIRDLIAPLGIACAIAALYLTGRSHPARDRWAWALLAAGMVGSSLGLRLYPGGYDNVRLTECAAIAILFGLGFHAGEARVAAAPEATRRAGQRALAAVATAQFLLLAWNPRAQVPTPADRAAGREAVAAIAGMPGEVLVPSHPYLLGLAGRPLHFHEMPFSDVLGGARGPIETRLLDSLDAALAARRYAAVVTDPPEPAWLLAPLERWYRPTGTLIHDPRSFFTVTGARTRPERIWLPDTAGAR